MIIAEDPACSEGTKPKRDNAVDAKPKHAEGTKLACFEGTEPKRDITAGTKPKHAEGTEIKPECFEGTELDPKHAEVTKPKCAGTKLEHDHAEGTEIKPEHAEGTEPEGTALSLKCTWLLSRRKSIGWHKDRRKVKHGLYNYIGVCESNGLASSAPPQQVLSALMIDQDPGNSDSVLLKSELQRDLKNSLACNIKDAASIECLK